MRLRMGMWFEEDRLFVEVVADVAPGDEVRTLEQLISEAFRLAARRIDAQAKWLDRYNNGLPQPFIFEQGKAWILGNLGKRGASAWDINEHDQIVGDASGHAVTWTRR